MASAQALKALGVKKGKSVQRCAPCACVHVPSYILPYLQGVVVQGLPDVQ